jgi:putative salt-induced outer membrane protein YdiY
MLTSGRRALFVLLVALSLPGPLRAQSSGDSAAPAREVRAREQALSAAMHARDQPALEMLLAADYVLRGVPDVDRDTWIRNAVTLCWGDRSDIDDFQAHPVDDVVVATFELTFYRDPSNCRQVVLRSLVTDVWIRQGDEWRLQMRHAAAPPAAGAGVAAQFGVVPQPPPAWDVRSEFSLASTAGNTATRTIGVAGSALHRSDGSNTRASFSFLTSEADAVTNARALNSEARHGVRIGGRTDAFAQGAWARDRFAGIADRIAGGAGLAYKPALTRQHVLTVESSIGFTSERRTDESTLRFATATTAFEYAWTLKPGAQFTQQAALFADLEAAGNWRATSGTAISISLTRLLSLRASHGIEYRHAPVAGFRRTDMRTAATFVLSFQQRRLVP